EADVAVRLPGNTPAETYLRADLVIEAARQAGADAVHPGYGFLSENADFARTVEASGLIWVGPGADAITAMGDKINARNLMAAAGVPVAPGTTDPAADLDAAVVAAAEIGYPVMVKAAAGGGGMGMASAADEASLRAEYERVRGFAERMFGDGSVFVERYFPSVRHVEVQILGLADGRVVALGERECSVQRRNQKLVEESPSPASMLTDQRRAALHAAAVRAGEAVGYRNAGTVECLLDPATGDFYFLEMNTRLQVEHPVTEAVFGLDLVEQQLRIASGLAPTFDPAELVPRGHAIELRVNAEDPKRFLPGPGAVSTWQEPEGPGIRVDSGYAEGTTVTPNYDSLMAKVIAYGETRAEAIERARAAVAGFAIAGPKHNLPFFAELLDREEFLSGDYDTAIVSRMR
ncbi:MAG TPA: biotin carboxylase N-terminal domain-containing protein, partial [Micromonosporaceae bacterium]